MKILLLIFSLSSVTLYGQQAKFIWYDEMCKYESSYNSAIYTETQLKNCYAIVILDAFRIQNTPFVFSHSDIAQLNPDSLENEYKRKSYHLRSLDLPKTKIWTDIRFKKLKELEQIYNLSSIAFKAYMSSNPIILKQFKKTDTCLVRHSDAIIKGGDDLLNDWYFVTAQQAAKNAYPEKIWETYYQQFNSKDKYIYAKIEVITFGWWNCALNHIEYFNNSNAIETYLKLFITTKTVYCEEF